MSHRLTLAELDTLHPIAVREARRVCRLAQLPAHDHDDVQQDLLLDLLLRLRSFDPARGSLAAFATVCFRHCGIRLASRARRARRARDLRSLDEPLRFDGEERLTRAETIPEAEGYGAWCGQQTDALVALERRLDLERAASAVPERDHSLCAALARATPHALGRDELLPRSVLYRRIGEIRLRFLAAGITAAA